MKSTPAIDRFNERFERLPWSGCWIWTGCVNNTGYGALSVDGKRDSAHRFSWSWHRGKIPSGKFVLHKCDVRSCVNPSHLFLGNQKENLNDAQNKGKLPKLFRNGVCAKGHPDIPANHESWYYKGLKKINCKTCRNERRKERYARKAKK